MPHLLPKKYLNIFHFVLNNKSRNFIFQWILPDFIRLIWSCKLISNEWCNMYPTIWNSLLAHDPFFTRHFRDPIFLPFNFLIYILVLLFKVHSRFISEGSFYRKFCNILALHGIRAIQCFPDIKLPVASPSLFLFQFVLINSKFIAILIKFLNNLLCWTM